jgi:hypothetical protein
VPELSVRGRPLAPIPPLLALSLLLEGPSRIATALGKRKRKRKRKAKAPGEGGSAAIPTAVSNWPDRGARPRSATIVITRTDGGVIGM